MLHVIKVDGWIRACICTDNKADKYGKPKEFRNRKDAQRWIDEHSYKGMSFKYEISEV